MVYCTPAEVREVATQITATSEPVKWTDDVLAKVIERASRIFDQECNVGSGYFEPAPSPGVSARTFYGDGTNYLKLDPYVAGSLDTSITLPEGYTAPTFVEREGFLVLSSNGVLPPFRGFYNCSWPGWYSGVAVIISARWGYAATPADVKHAIIEFTINLCKETDPASIKLMSLDNQPLRERMPPRVQMIAKKYKYKGAVV